MSSNIPTLLIFLLISVLRAGAQDGGGLLPQVLPSYTMDFLDNKSFPAVGLETAWQDSTGRLWLPTISAAGNERLYMFTFDGYDFRLVTGALDTLRSGANLSVRWKDRVFCGLVEEGGRRSLFSADLNTQAIVYYALPEHRSVFDPVATGGGIAVLSELPDAWTVSTLTDDGFGHRQVLKPARLQRHGDDPRRSRIMHFDSQQIWQGALDSLWHYDLASGTVQAFHLPGDGDHRVVRITIQETGNRVFVVLNKRKSETLYRLDMDRRQLVEVSQVSGHYRTIKVFTDSVGNTLINCTEPGRQHRAWLLTSGDEWLDYSMFVAPLYGAGMDNVIGHDFRRELVICHSAGLILQQVAASDGISHYLHGYSIRAMTQLSNEKVLITLQEPDQFVLNLNTRRVRRAEPMFHVGVNRFIEPNDDQRWLGTADGIARTNASMTETAFEIPCPVPVRYITPLGEDSLVLYTAKAGMFLADIASRTATPLFLDDRPVEIDGMVHDLHARDSSVLWIASTKGLWKVDLIAGTLDMLGTEHGFTDSRFLCIHEADDGRLWLGTVVGGIQIFNPESGAIQVMDDSRGLCNNTVVSIEKDQDGVRWVGTYNGIALVSPDGALIANLHVEDGLIHRENNRFSSLVTRDGHILIGGVAGLHVIDPKVIKDRLQRDEDVRIYLTDIAWYRNNHEQIHVDDPWELDSIQPIILPAGKRSLGVGFALSNFFNAESHQYAYQLEGREDRWRQAGNQHFLEFDDLPPGNYTLHIRGVDATGKASINTIRIPITARAFLYERWWFYPLCILLIAGLSFLLIMRLRAEIRKATAKIRADKEVIEHQAGKLQELDAAKSRFFTNISHEFRTPLTIISGMSAKILDNPEVWATKGAEMIRKNSGSLMDLVNQILDLRKLEASEMQLQMVQGDMIFYMKYLVDSFRHYVESEGKQLHFLSRPKELVMDYDPEKILQILSNLITNAIKYTGAGTDIYVTVDKSVTEVADLLLLRVEDKGPGIDPEKLPHIFDRFFQADSKDAGSRGTGIGLALTKELVLLMKGTIDVESTPDEGTRFDISLPVTRNAPVSAGVSRPMSEAIGDSDQTELPLSVTTHSDLPHVLVVEDNDDITQFLMLCLQPLYQLSFAKDGREGIDIALEAVPDLIVSDVMMPEVDGFELCQMLRQDPRTDHIPIVLLTAKADQKSKLSGLKHGADDYLTKPFEPDELLQRLENLLAIRRSLQERYSGTGVEVGPTKTPRDAFIAKLETSVKEHIDDPEFGVLQLCRAAGLGRSQLHSKLKALTGMSATIFIRHVRLVHAQKLLKTTEMNVSEVAYSVGFSDPRFFTRVFTEKFGAPPSRTRK